MLRSAQNFTCLNIITTPWNICQRGISNKSLLEKLGLPEKPKRPISPFIKYVQTVKPKLLKNNPDIKISEATKLAAQLWKNVNSDEKEKLSEKFKEEFQKYKKDLEKYENSLTADQKHEIREAEEEIRIFKEQKLMKQLKQKREKELKKPKAPSYPFFRFCQSVDKGNSRNAEHWKKMSEKWAKLSDSEKQKYVDMYEADKEQYIKDLTLWEEEMIKQGNLDLVRSKTLKHKIKNYSP